MYVVQFHNFTRVLYLFLMPRWQGNRPTISSGRLVHADLAMHATLAALGTLPRSMSL